MGEMEKQADVERDSPFSLGEIADRFTFLISGFPLGYGSMCAQAHGAAQNALPLLLYGHGSLT